MPDTIPSYVKDMETGKSVKVDVRATRNLPENRLPAPVESNSHGVTEPRSATEAGQPYGIAACCIDFRGLSSWDAGTEGRRLLARHPELAAPQPLAEQGRVYLSRSTVTALCAKTRSYAFSLCTTCATGLEVAGPTKCATCENAENSRRTLDTFTRQYLETALWSSTDESREDGGDPLDSNYDINDIAPETIERAVADCARFQEENA